MRFAEQIEVPVPVVEAWNFLWHTQRLAACLPGCSDVEELEPGKKYRARYRDHVGPYQVLFDLDILVEDSEPQDFIRVLVTGKDKRLGAAQKAVLNISLRKTGSSATTLDISAEVQVLGKIASLGDFAIKRRARDVISRFALGVQAELQPAPGGGSYA